MKELTIEEKAKRFDEALEVARSIRFGNPNSATANVVCEDIFPELKEIDDERIRKELIFYFGDMPEDTELRNGITNRDALCWIEEQNPQTIKEALRTEYEKGRADAIAEMQNPAKSWTEEDERKLELIKSLIDDVKEDCASYSTLFREMDELNKWVESFKNRAQPKQELKEDDIEITTAHWANA